MLGFPWLIRFSTLLGYCSSGLHDFDQSYGPARSRFGCVDFVDQAPSAKHSALSKYWCCRHLIEPYLMDSPIVSLGCRHRCDWQGPSNRRHSKAPCRCPFGALHAAREMRNHALPPGAACKGLR